MLLFEVEGIPDVQKQTRWTRSGHAFNPSSKDIQRLQWQIKPYAPKCPLTGAIEMNLTFYLPIPKSVSSRVKTQMLNGVILPTKRPDFDNLAYLVTNALKQLVYADDSQITDATIRKRYSDRPRTVIKIIPIEQMSQVGGTECG